MSEQKKNGVFGGLVWTFGERIITQLVSTVVAMVLARILAPSHYGLISIVSVFIALCNIFVTSGFGSAVVREKNADEETFNTSFVISFSISVLIYAVMFFSSPFVAAFYEQPLLTAVMRVMGLSIPLSALNHVQHAYLQRNMQFKRFFFASLFGTLLSGVVGIAMALLGFGVWALVAQQLTNVFMDIVVLFFVGGWRPRFQYSKQKARSIFTFGWKVLASDFVMTLETNLRSLIIGKVFGSADLAFYDQGRKYTGLLVDNVNSSISTVMLPVYAKYQDNHEELKKVLRRSIKMGIFCLVPMLMGFMGVAENFVIVFLTEKWLPCVPFLQICCIAYITRPLETTCLKMILAIGRSDVTLKSMVVINVVAFSTLLAGAFVFKSMLYVALGSIVIALTSLICFMTASNRLIGYKLKEQLCDILPGISLSLVMLLCVYLVGMIDLSPIILLILQIAVGVAAYVALSFMFNRKMVNELLGMLKKKTKKEDE